MLPEIKLDPESQERIEQIAEGLQAHLRDKEGEIYPLTELIVAVESWLESCVTELLTDAEEHLFAAPAHSAMGRHHLKDAISQIESTPIAAPIATIPTPVAA